ncbi:hypothetical protein PCLA_08r0009 [Pseudomonas citronellolis]|nr:hypothetical protein PCLA_08r0009 [Pseudomonas citronellolis]
MLTLFCSLRAPGATFWRSVASLSDRSDKRYFRKMLAPGSHGPSATKCPRGHAP